MDRDPHPHRRRASWILASLALVAAVALVVHGPIPQDDGYHTFADSRAWFGVPNGADVFSNAPFFFVGLAGFSVLRRARRAPRPPQRWAQLAFALFSFAITATTLGSGLYHLAPTNRTLVYDRLPMSLGFATLVALVVGERLGDRVGRATLVPAALLGVGSVLVWRATLDDTGHGGDLRLYAFVQFFAMITVASLIALVPEPRATRRPIVLACGAYALAKALEILDGEVLRATAGVVSGHALKHVAAAVAAAFLVRWFAIATRHAQ